MPNEQSVRLHGADGVAGGDARRRGHRTVLLRDCRRVMISDLRIVTRR